MRPETATNHLKHLDLYALLEVNADATGEEIRRAYRRGALACHPDKHPDDQQAAQRFVLLTQARDVLLDPELRAAYDGLRARRGAADEREYAPGGRPRRRGPRRGAAADPLTEQRLAERARRTRSAAELTSLWRSGRVVVRAAILRNPSCPAGLFSDPGVEAHWMLSLEAASRSQCPPDVLARLAHSFERSVAMAVAAHPATSAEALSTVAGRHRDLPLLTTIAVHPNASPAVLRQVGRAVRGPRSAALGSAVLAHPACPADLAQHIRARMGDLCA